MKKSLIAGASVMALAGAVMPMAGVFADADIRTAQDTINVTVSASCTFKAGGVNTEYSATGTNTSGQVNPINASSSSDHNFTVFCNNNSGYNVKAVASALTNASIAAADHFAYKATLPSSGTTGAWHASFSGTGTTSEGQLPDGGAETTIINRVEASGADGEEFKATYSAYIGTESPAATYTGTIGYTLAPNA